VTEDRPHEFRRAQRGKGVDRPTHFGNSVRSEFRRTAQELVEGVSEGWVVAGPQARVGVEGLKGAGMPALLDGDDGLLSELHVTQGAGRFGAAK
jgi:hypothetical protein